MVRLVITAAGLILLFASYASAGQSGDYLGISSGAFLLKSKLTDREGSTGDLKYDKVGIPVSVTIGHQFGVGLRLEEEVFYKTATTKELHYTNVTSKIDSDVWSIGAMTNLYYDWFHNVKALADGPYSPYVGLGVGFANVNMSEGTTKGDGTIPAAKLWNSGNDTALAYQVMIGTGIPIYKNISLDVSYRYFATTDIHIDQIKTSYYNHNYLLGIRYLFR